VPPIQPSVRGSLLTGASALALSVSAANAQSGPPNLTAWVEGARFWSSGGNVSIPASLNPPGHLSLRPAGGFEGAVGFDYRWQDRAWHFVFDLRYGRTKTANRGSAAATFATVSPFPTLASSTRGSQATQRESHLVADFMIGRDLGIGANTPEVLFGVRVADLRSTVHLSEVGQRTFYSSSTFITVPQSANATWRSRFFGAGPRLAITGGIPITGPWSFDYSGGVAGLLGDRTFQVQSWNSVSVIGAFAAKSSPTVMVFNADGSAAISYVVNSYFKLSGGIRGDYYSAPLTTFNVSTGGTSNISRFYWGPFARLTGVF